MKRLALSVDWPTTLGIVVSLALVIIAILAYRETRKQRKATEKQVEVMESQTEAAAKPVLSLRLGRTEANTLSAAWTTGTPYYVVLKNSVSGGPAKHVIVETENNSGYTGRVEIPMIDSGEEKESGVPAGTKTGDTLKVVVKYKDSQDRDCPELKQDFAYP